MMGEYSVAASHVGPRCPAFRRATSAAARASATLASTRTRLPATQTWPALNRMVRAMQSAARLRSASAKTSCGLLPPSSSVIGLTPLRAIFSMIADPATVEPVKLTLPMPVCPVRALPVVRPSPRTTLTSPAGMPACTDSSAMRSVAKGVISDGFSTTALPAASAGPSFQPAIEIGKFQGVIAPTTPKGSVTIMPSWSPRVGTSSPPSLSAISAKKRICSAVTAMSPATSWLMRRVEATASSCARCPASASIRSAQRCRARVRSRGWQVPQPEDLRAAFAVQTASSTRSAPATGRPA
ncbi:hypothetical protein FALB51S_04023 [Frigidibacter albus]